MSTQTEQGKKSSERLVILALVFLVPIIAIILLIKSFSSGATDPQAMTEEAITARIAPVAQYNTGAPAPVLASDANREPLTGEQVYNKLCMSCHDTGLLESPKIGDNAAWAPRLAQGEADVYNKAINGFNAMPARGGDATLSDLEVKRAVAFMVNKSGGNFAEPTDGDAAPAAEAAPAETAVDAAKEAVTDAAQAVEQKVEAAVEATKEAAADATEAVEQKTEAAVEATKEAAADAAQAVEQKVEAAVEATKEAAADATEAVEQKTEAAVEATKEAAADATQAVEQKVEAAVEATKEAAADVAQAVEQKTEAAVEATKEAVAPAAPAEVPLNQVPETDSTASQPAAQ